MSKQNSNYISQHHERRGINRRQVLACSVCGLLLLSGCFDEPKPMTHPMNIKILASINEFFTSNHISPTPFLDEPLSSAITFMFEGHNYKTEEDIDYDVSLTTAQTVHFPLMRQVSVNHDSGHITGFDGWLPVEMIGFEEVMLLANQITKSFRDAGYQENYRSTNLTPQLLAENLGRGTHSRWTCPIIGKKENGILELDLNIVSSASFGGSTLPPLAVLFTRGDRKNFRYGIRIDAQISNEILNEIIDLSIARKRLDIQNPNAPIDVDIWYNDPDWRPEGWDGKFI